MFSHLGPSSGEFDIFVGKKMRTLVCFFSSLLNILFLISFYSNYEFVPYYRL